MVGYIFVMYNKSYYVIYTWSKCYIIIRFWYQIQEFRTGAARQNMETVHAKEESKKLRDNLNDLRKRLADAEARVSERAVLT